MATLKDIAPSNGLFGGRCFPRLEPAARPARPCGAGTIYKKMPAYPPGRGTVLLNGYGNSGYTDVTALYYPPKEADHAPFYLTNDFSLGDIYLQQTNTVLNLGSNTLYVKTTEHSLSPGVVTNYGRIVWLVPGTVFSVK